MVPVVLEIQISKVFLIILYTIGSGRVCFTGKKKENKSCLPTAEFPNCEGTGKNKRKQIVITGNKTL